jgi:hypothetical protein
VTTPASATTPAPTARTLASVILLWDDGTRTRLDTKEP